MRLVIQRVSSAEVQVDGDVIAHIGLGLVILTGVGQTDTEADADMLAQKVAHLRIFEDTADKMNLSVSDVHGDVLVVSQFTLFANMTRGRRPSFIEAAEPELGRKLYEHFAERLHERGLVVRTGQFGAHMEVSLTNDGPVTIWMDSSRNL